MEGGTPIPELLGSQVVWLQELGVVALLGGAK